MFFSCRVRVRTCFASVCKASMENHQCEKCRLFKPTVEHRSGDELLCDTCWKSPKEHSVLNATAKPFLPRSSESSIAQRVNRRRSRSTGAIIEMKNSQCETRTSSEKSIIHQGEEKETSVKRCKQPDFEISYKLRLKITDIKKA